MATSKSFDTDKFINSQQVGGIDAYTIDEGEGRGVRSLCVNTGGGLRYRVLVDRGLDIDQAFLNQHSLVFLTHKGVTKPTRALDRGIDWLKSFPGGLLTTCGPTSIGPDAVDDGDELGVHGPHSNTAAEIESVIQPDPRQNRMVMSITGIIRYGQLYGPCLELRRTIRSTLGSNVIDFSDEFFNAANVPVPHAWLLHINFGYPLIDVGTELCYDAQRLEPREDAGSQLTFSKKNNYKMVPRPRKDHCGKGSAVAYIFPRTRNGRATVGVVNQKLSLGVGIHYDTRQFPRCGNWQHYGPHEYVAALEPMNGTVEGRDKDRSAGLLDFIKPGGRKVYQYQIEGLTKRNDLDALRKLNRR